ncbi:MAG: class I SAM-dependent methyltransferase [Pseudomonadota bacterium]
MGKIDLQLSGVPETMLWPLWNRAAEMRRNTRLIEDPLAVELVGRINYDFQRSFGKPTAFHPIRARVTDDLIADYAKRVETPVVVALGEGLETQLWRLDHPDIQWISVDVPDAIATRNSLLPDHPNATCIDCSALDISWMDHVPSGTSPFITAAGLFMYFEAEEIRSLMTTIGKRFPGAELFFDTITPFVSKKTLKGAKVTKHYTAPAMPWGISFDDLPSFIAGIPGWDPVSIQTYTDPFPSRMRPYNWLKHIGPIRRAFAGSLVHARVSRGSPSQPADKATIPRPNTGD